MKGTEQRTMFKEGATYAFLWLAEINILNKHTVHSW